jgi:hypothetical protein
MKKVFLVGLLALVGAFSMLSTAQAGSRYCVYNPEDPRCFAHIPDGEDGYYPPSDDDADLPMWDDTFGHRRHGFHHRSYDEQGSTLTFEFGSKNSCSNIAQSLKRTGFRRVKPVDCAGRDYAFTAIRDGESLKVWVKSATGRISKITPY